MGKHTCPHCGKIIFIKLHIDSLSSKIAERQLTVEADGQ